MNTGHGKILEHNAADVDVPVGHLPLSTCSTSATTFGQSAD